MFAASKTASVSGGYQISRSLRFNSADSAYLNRTPASATNRQTWTWSGWVKRSALGAYSTIFGHCSSDGLQQHTAWFRNDDTLQFYIYSSGYNLNLITTQVFRDVSAWYHIVIAQDTTQATDTNRAKIYVNGVQVTAFSTAAYPTQNTNGFINSNVAHGIGSFPPALGSYFNGYQTEINLIDGQDLTPSSFGETNAQTGVWQPKAYSGSYGTNGFYLNFSDNSNTTAATLGKDYSGNGNNWTPTNFSVSAGVTNDSMVDVPTPYGVDTGLGGEVRGNYCTINPLDGVGTPTISDGNLKFVNNNANGVFRGTIGMPGGSGKWYFEITQQTAVSPSAPIVYGMATLQSTVSHSAAVIQRAAFYYTDLSGKYLLAYFNGAYTLTSIATAIAINEVLQFAYDSDTGKVWVGKGGVWSDSSGGTTGNPSTGANPTYTFASVDQPMTPTFDHAGVAYTATLNCGQRVFVNTAPSGFKALCTQNLPTPTIGATTATQATQFFTPVTYTGTGATQTVTVGFETGLLWGKQRNDADRHWLADQVRGLKTTGYYLLTSSSTAGDTTSAAPDGVTAITSTGFTLGANTSNTDGNWSYEINQSGGSYVAWNWKANGTGVTNTSGSITSTVSANTTSGFSIVTYTGTAVAATIGHGLGSAPSMIITKQRNGGPWAVYHTSLGIDQYVFLNTTDAANTVTGYWGTTNPSSTVFGVIGGGYNNNSGPTVAYCFAEIAGYSKFGSYTGNGSTDGPFVFTGFRPAFILFKRYSGALNDWRMTDSSRSTYNPDNTAFLYPNQAYAENSNANDDLDMLSNGFKIRATAQASNESGSSYIYMAFAESPFKHSLAR